MSQKYATFDPATGILNARYDAAINTAIPANAVPLDDATFLLTMQPTTGTWQLVNGACTLVPQPAAQALAAAQAAQIAALQAAYEVAISAPVTFKNAAGVTSTYPAGDTMGINRKTATENLANVIASGASAWTMGHWLDTAGVAQVFTFADLQGLAVAMEAVDVADWQDLVAKIAAVQAATTVAAVQAVIF